MFFSAGATLQQCQQRRDTQPLDALETRLLLSHVLGLSRIELITQSERVISATEAAQLDALFQRRIDGEPMAYILGQREFYGLMFHVSPAVLIPRPDTELLVELALQRLPPSGSVVDLGTGSGAIAVVLAQQRPDAAVTALDLSAAALDIARANASRHGTQVRFLQSDWYSALQQQNCEKFDLIVANPPYIVQGDIHLSQGDLRFEPIDALTDHADGLSALRRIITDAPQHLAADGWLLMEHGYDQAAAVRQLLTVQGFREAQSWHDLSDIQRVSGARRPL
ncbi:MAG: peptide chain release factor N(5)-glutamine methyltransferase [Pseudomonadota bacterium]